jgi:hypothetical protein
LKGNGGLLSFKRAKRKRPRERGKGKEMNPLWSVAISVIVANSKVYLKLVLVRGILFSSKHDKVSIKRADAS